MKEPKTNDKIYLKPINCFLLKLSQSGLSLGNYEYFNNKSLLIREFDGSDSTCVKTINNSHALWFPNDSLDFNRK